jgi:hypothetical protein
MVTIIALKNFFLRLKNLHDADHAGRVSAFPDASVEG